MPRKTRVDPAAWFATFPPVDPPGWDDKEGWCRRHWAPLAAIPDPAARAAAQRVASLDLMGVFARSLRARVSPLPVPAHYLAALVRELSPVCCWVREDEVYALVRDAVTTAGRAS